MFPWYFKGKRNTLNQFFIHLRVRRKWFETQIFKYILTENILRDEIFLWYGIFQSIKKDFSYTDNDKQSYMYIKFMISDVMSRIVYIFCCSNVSRLLKYLRSYKMEISVMSYIERKKLFLYHKNSSLQKNKSSCHVFVDV